MINVSIENVGQAFLINRSVVQLADSLLTGVIFNKEDADICEIINRILNLLAKLSRDQKGAQQIAESKNLLLRVILYLNKTSFPLDMVLQALRILHNCCKSANGFREIYLDTHKFTVKNLDTVVNDTLSIFTESLGNGDWDNFTNACSLVSALSDCFPERSSDFASMIVPLIQIIKEKVDATRKTAAVCLAKLARDEENGKIMRANHGTEVLVSLGNVLAK